jgi:hypothetical protein
MGRGWLRALADRLSGLIGGLMEILPPGLVDYIILWVIMMAWIMYIVMAALLAA